MSLIGIKTKNQGMQYFAEERYLEKNKEKHLEKVIQEEPKIFSDGISEGDFKLIGKQVVFPSKKKLDLLFCDRSGDIFVVEIKRDSSPRDALAQLIDYSASIKSLSVDDLFNLPNEIKINLEEIYDFFEIDDQEEFLQNLMKGLTEPKLVLISYEINEDVKRIAKDLREHGYIIYCIEFDYYTDDEKDIEIFVPKQWGAYEAKEVANKSLTESKKIYLNFWTEVIELFKSKVSNVTDRNGTADSWMQIPIGYSDCHLEFSLTGKRNSKLPTVGLHLEGNNKDKNLEILTRLKQFKKDGEIFFGNITYDENFGTNWCKIYSTYNETFKLDSVLENNSLKEWFVDMMKKYYSFFKKEGRLDSVIKEVI